MNNMVHGDGKDTVAGSVHYLIRLHNDLLAAACDPEEDAEKGKLSLAPVKPTVPLHPSPRHWVTPPLGKAKLNTDAAFLGETGETWAGAVARDHKGRVFMSIGRSLDRCSSVEEAEGAAALMGLTEFAKLYTGQLILETDCTFVGRELQTGSNGKSACHTTLADAGKMLGAFARAEINIINRSKNKLAHELAALARGSGDFFMIADVPADAKHVMRAKSVSTMA